MSFVYSCIPHRGHFNAITAALSIHFYPAYDSSDLQIVLIYLLTLSDVGLAEYSVHFFVVMALTFLCRVAVVIKLQFVIWLFREFYAS